jgi:UDP-N-acetylmuramoyl-tripeptide--D-alanyl-D-alanine ligase
LADAVEASQADLVFCCGPAMHALFEAIPAARRGAYGKSSAEIAPLVVHALRAGDIVLVKGSFGSRMAVIVDALKAQGRVA